MESDTVRRRILDFLAQQARPVTAAEILQDVLGIRSPNAAAAERVLHGIMGDDPHLRRQGGRWACTNVTRKETGAAWQAIAALHVQAPAGRGFPATVRGALHVSISGRCKDFPFTGASGTRLLSEAALQTEPWPLLVWGRRELRLWNRLLQARNLAPARGEAVLLGALARRIFGRPVPAPEDLARLLGLRSPDAEDPRAAARFLAEAFFALLERVPEEHRADAGSLASWAEGARRGVDLGRFAFGRELLSELPAGPGIYLMRNRAGEIIYVGKAANLRRRVRSYFTPSALEQPKIARMHEQLHRLEFAPAASEVEALVMEMRLIRDFRPPFNRQSEVHEKPAHYGRPRNLIILVREEGESAGAAAYLVRNSLFAGREAVIPGAGPDRKLRRRVRSTFFARHAPAESPGEPWEQEIVSRWLRSNLKRFTAVDVDEAGEYRSVIRQLGACLRDPEAFAKKVYYR